MQSHLVLPNIELACSLDPEYAKFYFILTLLVPVIYNVALIFFQSTKAMVETYIYTNYALAVTGLNRSFRDYVVTGVPVILISLVSSAYGN